MNLDIRLEGVKAIIDKELITGDRYLDGSLDYLKLAKGKMLRPSFLLIGASFGEEVINEKRVKEKGIKEKETTVDELASAIEILHIATLVHDDIIDEAKLRRGQSSIQSKYSKEYAVYMGDFLLSRCFMMLSQLSLERELGIRFAKAMNQICVGEMKQNKFRYDFKVTPFQYLQVISRKTALLFSLSLSAGAYFTHANKDIAKLLTRIGLEIGMAFQLEDDLLDYLGVEELVGKELQSDVLRGYYNIPVLFALHQGKDQKKVLELQQLLEKGDVFKERIGIMQLIEELGGIDKTRKLSLRYKERAMGLINTLPDSEGKLALLKLVPELINRQK